MSLSSEKDNSEFKRVREVAKEYNISIPDAKPVSAPKFYDYEYFVDFEDIEQVNKAIYHAKRGLFKANNVINEYESKIAIAETVYNRQWRRIYLGSDKKTDTARKADADLACELLEDDVIVFKHVKEDLKRVSNVLRIELQSLQTISSNIRQQINVL